MTSPLYSSAYWLFISQARAKEMMQVTMAASVLNVASYLVGALWGVVGIAMCAALVFVFITTPLMLYAATRRGPVTPMDLLRCVFPFILRSGAVYALLFWAQQHINLPGIFAITAMTALSYGGFVALIFLMPGGSRYVDDVRRMVALLRNRKA